MLILHLTRMHNWIYWTCRRILTWPKRRTSWGSTQARPGGRCGSRRRSPCRSTSCRSCSPSRRARRSKWPEEQLEMRNNSREITLKRGDWMLNIGLNKVKRDRKFSTAFGGNEWLGHFRFSVHCRLLLSFSFIRGCFSTERNNGKEKLLLGS